ncbi:RNI-like protein [Crepidotus variabilis]|uniref:RNI-like protein n=1 Tax=Crepidotus variabilis TaxID=179855 RepID=A0A9P6E4V9_9AGAR|nr:RNI-like protein [Crepidotus variabilis]
MSRRGNNVRGPTSALTEFLKDSGITATTIARRVATRNQNDDQPVAGPSNTPATPSTPATTSRRRRLTRTSGFASDELDEPETTEPLNDAMDVDNEEEEKATAPKKRKLTKAAEAKLKAKEKKKRGKKDSDEEDEDEDAYTKVSKSLWATNSPKPPVGSFAKCTICKNQFTVTKYTMAANSGDGWLCHTCAKAGGKDPFKKPAVPKKRVPADKRTVTSFQEKRFPTLVTLCIQLITEHIDDVDALGDIGTMNVEAIAKALSKTRSLTPQNAQLFYNSTNKSLTLFDVTSLNSPALETLAYHNSNLVSLRLDFCGQLTDESLKVWTTSLPSLERLELLGPFLVRPPGWQAFFKAHPNLEGFLLTQSPRFDITCMQALVSNCAGLKDLRLKEVGLIDDSFVAEIQKLDSGVRLLDLSDPSKTCSQSAIIELMTAIGSTLEHLDLSKHDDLGHDFLTEGLQPHVTQLETLALAYLPELTDDGVAQFFKEWKNAPLRSLNFSRNQELAGSSLNAILKHSGERLEHLNINGWKTAPENELKRIGRTCVELRKLDVGWCREVDDFLLLAWLNGEKVRGAVKGGCKRLEEVKVWGCNKVTASCPRKKGVIIMGVEAHIVA